MKTQNLKTNKKITLLAVCLFMMVMLLFTVSCSAANTGANNDIDNVYSMTVPNLGYIVINYKTEYQNANVYIDDKIVNADCTYNPYESYLSSAIGIDVKMFNTLYDIKIELLDNNDKVAEVSQLKNVYIAYNNINDDEIPKKVQLLYLAGDNSIKDFKDYKKYKSLQALYIDSVDEDKLDLNDIADIPNLKKLSLKNSDNVVGKLSDLDEMNQLEFLSIDFCKGIRGELADLNGLINLTHLSIRSHDITGELADIADFVQLKELTINGYLDGSVADLNNFTNLTSLSLSGIGMDLSGDISELTDLNQLETLDIRCLSLSGDFSAIAHMSDYTSVMLRGSSNDTFSVEIEDFYNMTDLRQLILYSFKDLNLEYSQFCQLEGLTSLRLSSNDNITGNIGDLSAMTNLEDLSITNNPYEGTIEDITPLQNLKFLVLSEGSKDNPCSVAGLDKFPKLSSLVLYDHEGDLGVIADMPSLENLTILFSKIEGQLSDLSSLENLKSLDLNACKNITGKLKQLSDMNSLRSLDIYQCDNIDGSIYDIDDYYRFLDVQ